MPEADLNLFGSSDFGAQDFLLRRSCKWAQKAAVIMGLLVRL